MSQPDLFVVCKNCGSEVSPYVTECPYCGQRVRKRAPKIDRSTGEPAQKRRRRARKLPRLRAETNQHLKRRELDSDKVHATVVRLICRAYFAVTSNTVQFGADAALYASAFGFSIQGAIGFDVLIQLLPFHFLAEFRASVQLKRGSRNLFKVSVAGALEGPLPLRASGKASRKPLRT